MEEDGGGAKQSLVGVTEASLRPARRSRMVFESCSWVEASAAECVRLEERATSRQAMWARRLVVSEETLDPERIDVTEGAVLTGSKERLAMGARGGGGGGPLEGRGGGGTIEG